MAMTDDSLHSSVRATAREWAGLVLLALPMMALATDLTVLFFALPTISADLEPSATQSLWITHVYGFLIAGFLVTAGRVADRVGPRRCCCWARRRSRGCRWWPPSPRAQRCSSLPALHSASRERA